MAHKQEHGRVASEENLHFTDVDLPHDMNQANDEIPNFQNIEDYRYFSDTGPRGSKGTLPKSSRRFSEAYAIPSNARLISEGGSGIGSHPDGSSHTSSYSSYLSPLRNKSSTSKTSTDAVDRSSLLQDLIISSVISMQNISKLSVQEGKEPLSLAKTTHNFRRFVQKAGPIFAFQDKVESIIKWENPVHTFLVMSIYSLVCLFPQLLILTPQIIIITIIVNNYKHRHDPTDPSSPKNRTPAVGSVDYLKNMQHIQNMMGMVADGAEEVEKMAQYFNWTEPVGNLTSEAKRINIDENNENLGPSWSLLILQISVLSSLVLLIGPLWWIPWRYVALFGGWAGILTTTPFFRALMQEVNPFLNTSSNIDMIQDVLSWWIRDVSDYPTN